MKKKLPMAPVRANVRGTCAVHFDFDRHASPPGATGCGSGTAITVSSSALPSSGAMKRFDAVRSVAGAPVRSERAESIDAETRFTSM